MPSLTAWEACKVFGCKFGREQLHRDHQTETSKVGPLGSCFTITKPMANREVPLCVDLDRTLIRTDALLESILILLKRNPFSIVQLPMWSLGGLARLKQEVCSRALPDVSKLPYRSDLLAFLSFSFCASSVYLPNDLGRRRPYELAVRLAATWPQELRRKFWAFRFGGIPPMWRSDLEAEGSSGSRGDCKSPDSVY